MSADPLEVLADELATWPRAHVAAALDDPRDRREMAGDLLLALARAGYVVTDRAAMLEARRDR